MKKNILIVLSAVFTLFACEKAPFNETIIAKEIIFKITVNHPEDTKAVKTGWVEDDKVYVFFQGVIATKYLELTYDGTDWVPALRGGLQVSDLTSSGKKMYGVFFPFEQPVIATDGGTGVTFKTGGEDPAKAGLGLYTYYMTSSAGYKVNTAGDIATLTGTLNMVNPTGYVQFYIGKDDEKTTTHKYNADYIYRLSIAGVKPTACVSYDKGVFGTKQLNAAQPMWGYKYGEGIAFSGVIDDTWSDDVNNHVLYLFDTEAGAKTITINGRALHSHDAVNFSTTPPSGWSAAATVPATTLYSELSWGNFNLGASGETTGPMNYGWYFMWGDIIPLPNTTIDSSDEYYQKTTAYEALVGKTVNLTGDYAIYDAATAFLGPSWRMPSQLEYSQLVSGIDPSIPENWDENSALIANAGIMLPAADYWLEGPQIGDGDGYYWSSSYCDDDESKLLFFSACYNYLDSSEDSYDLRYIGFSIRPVKNQ